jgi:hypothetical protein
MKKNVVIYGMTYWQLKLGRVQKNRLLQWILTIRINKLYFCCKKTLFILSSLLKDQRKEAKGEFLPLIVEAEETGHGSACACR